MDDLSHIRSLAGAICPELPVEDVIRIRDLALVTMQRAKQVADDIDLAIIEWINKNGDITVGDNRTYVGNVTRTKCKDNLETLMAVLAAADGDIETVAGCLSSNGFKHGAVKKLIDDPDAYDNLFEVTVAQNVKTGKPLKRLNTVDSKFLPST